MNWLEQLKNATLIEPLGWTILHSLWQGTAIAILTAIVLRLTRSRSAQLRYVIGCSAMLAMLVAAAATFARLRIAEVPPSMMADSSAPSIIAPIQPINIHASIATFHAAPQSWADRIRPILPSLALAWIAGVFLLVAYHAGGWMLLRRLRGQSKMIVDAARCALLNDLIAAMRIDRAVQFCESAFVQVPTVIGWLSPMILLPASAMIGLPPSELRGLLAHELAHIRRHDYLVNLLQTIIETLLFYHPAVWWLGKVIRQERENCCDDLAAAVCDRTIYAQALATMESLRQSPQFALSAKGAALLPRIRRILGMPQVSSNYRPIASGVISASIVITIIAAAITLNACRSNAKTPLAKSGQPTTKPDIPYTDPIANDLIAPTGPYRIVPTDVLNVTINDLQSAGTQSVVTKRVSNDGELSLPLIGSLHAAGDTEAELEKAIATKYQDAKLLTKAIVSINIVEGRGRTFSIRGAIGQPGQYAIPKNDFRILDALVMAKDVTPSANEILVIRGNPGSSTNQQRIIRISMDRLEHGDSQENIVVLPDDLIQVMPPPSASPPPLHGRITEAATGKPVPNVKVKIYGGTASRWLTDTTITDADGRYYFDHPSGEFIKSNSPGQYDVFLGMRIDHPTLCSADGQSWWDVTIPHDAPDVTEDFKLVPGGKLVGTVNNHLGQGDANLELKIYSKDNRSWCYATTDQHGQFTSASLFPADYAIAVNSRDNPQLASAQVQSEQNSQLELHYDSPTTEPSSSQDSVENLEYRLAVAGSEIEATNMKLKLADVAARSGKPIPEDQRHRLDDQLKTLTDDQDRLQITLAMAQHEVFPSSQPTTVPSRPSDQPSLGATQQPDNQTVQFLNGFRIQISQTEARIVATKADLAQAKKELAADDPKIAALQKLLYQREDALSTLIDHAIQAENAIDGNSRDAAKTVPSNSATTQPDNISSAPLADLQSTLHALNLLRQNERSKLDATIHAGGDNRFAVEQAQATLKSIDEQRAVVSNYIAAKSSQPQAATTQPVAATANGIAPNSPATQPALPQTGEYYISGIPQSGVYAMNREPITVLQALIKAGMQDWTPDENLTVIHRDGGRQEFKLSDVMNGAVGQTPVQPDDVLMVANNLPQGEYYVGGDVPRVGVYSLTRRRINVLQALIAAGTDPEKIGNDIVVIRHRVGPDKETVQRIAIKELLNDPSKEIVLQPNDMLQVGPASTSQPTTHP